MPAPRRERDCTSRARRRGGGKAPGQAGDSGAGYNGVVVPSERKLDVAAVKSLVVAGWTGRNVAALEAHIKELEAIGVKRPKTVPIFYRVAHSLLTSGDTIEVTA